MTYCITIKFSFSKKNVSSVTINTTKGNTFYNNVSKLTNSLKKCGA